MATSTVACNICRDRGIDNASAFWCFNCEEGCCTDCREVHKHDNATPEDCTITIEYHELPFFIIGIKMRCDALTNNIKTIIASGQGNLNMLNETKEGIEKEIKQTRLNINSYLDQLEKKLLAKLQGKSDNTQHTMMESNTTLAEKEKEILKCQDNLQYIEPHATDLATLRSLKQIQQDIKRNEQVVQSLIDDQKVYKGMLHCKIDKTLKKLTTGVRCFGEVTTSITPCDFTVIRSFQCNKCDSSHCMTCKMIQCTNIFRKKSTEKEFIIHCPVTCTTTNIIYLLECGICNLQYIGTTGRDLRTRMAEHRSEAKNNVGCSLNKHLRSKNHHSDFNKLKVTIIEHIPDWDVESRQEREHFWIRELDTLSPNGINKKM